MNEILQGFVLIIGLMFTALVLTLLVKKKIDERNVLFWLGGSVVVLVLAVSPGLLDWIARRVGIDYPPSLLFLASVLGLFIMILYLSIRVNSLQDKLKEVAQYVALHEVSEHSLSSKENEGLKENKYVIKDSNS